VSKIIIEGREFALPFKYDSGYIFDAAQFMFAQVRGWGALSSQLGEVKAAKVQDAIGQHIAEALNGWTPISEGLSDVYNEMYLWQASDEITRFVVGWYDHSEKRVVEFDGRWTPTSSFAAWREILPYSEGK